MNIAGGTAEEQVLALICIVEACAVIKKYYVSAGLFSSADGIVKRRTKSPFIHPSAVVVNGLPSP